MSTRGGEQLLLDIKGFPGIVPERAHLHTHYDCILNIRAEGVEMMD